MSKIPQSEWNAIATRHARGETIAKIAQNYGCTAPAIHYILKRQKERGGSAMTDAAPATMPATPPAPSPLRPALELRPASEVRPAAEPRAVPPSIVPPSIVPEARLAAELRPIRSDEPRRASAPAFTVGPDIGERRVAGPRPEPRFSPRGSALKAGLDRELQSQMEGAIETFRSNLDAALADRSPVRCEELRAAASDLMRMAARTMIVLDRLSAGHDQAAEHAPGYPRSMHTR
jgi:hypothetical protein